jgi:hypothetical protein
MPFSAVRYVSPSAVLSLLAALALGCSSAEKASGPSCNPCEGGTAAAPAKNPDGIDYPNPASGYGTKKRVGTTPGSVIANLHFLGYPNGDSSKGLQPVQLADYYDPCGKRLKVLHLSVAGVWCVPCNDETAAVVAAESTLKSEQVVVLQALSDGSMEGQPAMLMDLNYWVETRYKMTYTVVLDPGPTQFATYFIAAKIPWNADVDPRTMEIVTSDTGWNGDLTSTLQPGIDAMNAPPLYTVPASACSDR